MSTRPPCCGAPRWLGRVSGLRRLCQLRLARRLIRGYGSLRFPFLAAGLQVV